MPTLCCWKNISRKFKSIFCGFAYYLFCVVFIENFLFLSYWRSINSIPAATNTRESALSGKHVVSNVSPAASASSMTISIPSSLNRGPMHLLSNVVLKNPKIQFNNTNLFAKRHAESQNLRDLARNRLKTGGQRVNLTELEKRYYRRQPSKVNTYNHSLLVTPRTNCPPDTYMIVLVHTFHTHTDRRSAIRTSWGSVARTNGAWPGIASIKERIRLVFVLGLHSDPGMNELVREEAERYNDIAVGDFVDSYRNMTLKSLLGLKLVKENCSSARYLLKSDDDMFIHLPYLIDVLNTRKLQRAIMGPYNVGSRAYRSGKWRLTEEEFPFQYLPPYESGAAYIITVDLVQDLFETAEYVPSIFIDDVYITGILGKVLNVTHVKQDGFAFWTYRSPTVCDILLRKILTGTKATPALLRKIWGELQEGKQATSCQVTPPPLPISKPGNPRVLHQQKLPSGKIVPNKIAKIPLKIK